MTEQVEDGEWAVKQALRQLDLLRCGVSRPYRERDDGPVTG